MSDITFNITDLLLALDITFDEAEGLLDGFFEFKEGEMRKLAKYKNVPLEAVEEFFGFLE